MRKKEGEGERWMECMIHCALCLTGFVKAALYVYSKITIYNM